MPRSVSGPAPAAPQRRHERDTLLAALNARVGREEEEGEIESGSAVSRSGYEEVGKDRPGYARTGQGRLGYF